MNMPEFTGLKKEFTEAVADRLVRFSPESGVPDWSRILLVLPGKETIRNLSETLAARYGSLFPPVMITGNAFPLYGRDLSRTAGRAEEYCAWMEAVHAAPPEEYPGLLPGEQEDPSRKLALRSAFAFEDLRRELEEGGKTIKDIARITGEERFEKLARLEEQFLAVLKEQGKQPLLMEEQLNGTEENALDGFDWILFAGVLDLSPSGTRRAEKLLKRNRAQVWIYAPEEWKDKFDKTGHPLPPVSEWVKNKIRIRDFRKRVLKAEDPAEGAGIASALVTAAGELSPDKTRIISSDPSFFPFLREEMEKLGSGKTPPEIYDPAGEPLSGLRIAAFLRTLEAFLNDGDFESASSLLRNGDFLRSLTKQENEFLTELDRFRKDHLPDNPESVRIFLQTQPEPSILLPAFQRLKEIRDSFPEDGFGFVPALRELLNRVFPSTGLYPVKGIPFESEAAGVAAVLDEMEKGCFFSPDSGFALLRKLLESSKVYGDHTGFAYPIHGFYESPFFPPADTVLAGVNAGCLPERKQNTPFLTESLRKRLGLEGNAVQEVRDACRFAVLLEVCHAAGKTVDLLAFRNDASGAPCRFSPFLFGSEEDFLARTAQLYAEIPPLQESGKHKGSSLSFTLRPKWGRKEKGLTLSVTDFKSFLTSPFLFFLQRTQHWEERDYRGRDLDAAAFGNACHDAVQAARTLPASGENRVLKNRMKDRLTAYMKKHYGDPLPNLPALQKRQMEQRLKFASFPLLESLKEYRVIGIEYPLGGETEKSLPFRQEKNWRLKGRIDRIEYSDVRKELRLIDFKTFDRTPEQTHVVREKKGGQVLRFTDLQLPLYAILIRRDPVFRQAHPEIDWDDLTIRCGYFLMPPTEEGTGYSIWEQMDEPLLKLAEKQAEEIFAEAEAMQNGYFPEKWDRMNPYKDPMMESLQMPDLKTVFPDIMEKEVSHD